ncbi:MAG: redox-sensing transcriptional repressor Rex [Planctomycetota bacterium]|nr:redox-sensing transcriptional repressor Rex [Planctomycetota bacterium]
MSESKSKLFNDQGELVVPKPVVGRLSLYLREVQHLIRDGRQTTNSNELGRLLGVTDAQVRKDLAYFGQFGHPGVGYRCQELVAAIKNIMGTNTTWNVALIGIGNLGRALMRYKGFHEQGFQIVAVFDVDDQVIGTKVEDVDVYHIQHLAKIVMQQSIRLVTIAVPSHAAQAVADQVVDVGIEGILNFAPVTISVPSQVRVIGVDLAMELEQLAFTVVNRDSKS